MMQLKSSYQHSIQLVSPYNAQDSNYHPFISEFISKKRSASTFKQNVFWKKTFPAPGFEPTTPQKPNVHK